jgi:hypothetical protein
MVVGMRDDLERNKPGLGFVFWEDEFRGGEPLMELHGVSRPEGDGIRSFRLDDAGARSICFARGSAWLMAAQTDGRVRIYDFATGKPAGILGDCRGEPGRNCGRRPEDFVVGYEGPEIASEGRSNRPLFRACNHAPGGRDSCGRHLRQHLFSAAHWV